jgi:hypothetical protein
MSSFNFSETMKKGWHPTSKDGKSKESWRGDFKGIDQVVSVVLHPTPFIAHY